MRLSISKKLLQIADELDNLGFYPEADSITNLVRTAQIPGTPGWTPNPSVVAPQQSPPQTPQQITQQGQGQQPNLQQYQGFINGLQPNLSNIINAPIMPNTPYNSPQAPYDPRYEPNNTNNYQGWYNNNNNNNGVAQQPVQNSTNPQNIQQQLLNMPTSPLTVVKTGPDGKQYVQRGPTMQEYVNNYLKNMQKTQGQQGADQTVQNARQLQIDNEMQEAQNKYWQLAQERQNQSLGDGHQTLYK